MGKQKGMNVLVVSDDCLLSERIKEVVNLMGYTVIGEAVSGRKAVEMTASLQPHVVLMDIEMQDMDGFAATRLIHEQCPTPVVVLSANQSPEWVAEARVAGVGAYVRKPPEAGEIERAISIAMARFDDVVELRRLNAALEEAMNQVKVLKGVIPICMVCKKIRDDEGSWQDVAVYIRDHSEADCTHGLCQECAKKTYPDLDLDK